MDEVHYWKGSGNVVADALSRLTPVETKFYEMDVDSRFQGPDVKQEVPKLQGLVHHTATMTELQQSNAVTQTLSDSGLESFRFYLALLYIQNKFSGFTHDRIRIASCRMDQMR